MTIKIFQNDGLPSTVAAIRQTVQRSLNNQVLNAAADGNLVFLTGDILAEWNDQPDEDPVYGGDVSREMTIALASTLARHQDRATLAQSAGQLPIADKDALTHALALVRIAGGPEDWTALDAEFTALRAAHRGARVFAVLCTLVRAWYGRPDTREIHDMSARLRRAADRAVPAGADPTPKE